jgi:hypothetical protein
MVSVCGEVSSIQGCPCSLVLASTANCNGCMCIIMYTYVIGSEKTTLIAHFLVAIHAGYPGP